METRAWEAASLTCVGLLLFSVLTASAQDVRAGVEQLASQIAQAAPEGKQLRVAVADFPDLQGVTSELGRFVASRLTTRLAQTPKFFVVERQRLSQVLAELRFSMSDLVDPAKAKQLGRMVGVEAIIVGTVSDLGNQVDLDARMIEIETNRMLLGATATISKDQVVAQMLERGRQEVGSSMPATGPPAAAAVTPAAKPPVNLRGLKFTHNAFAFELSSAEIVDDDVKLTFLYTNKQDRTHPAILEEAYLTDNLGNRSNYTGDSFRRNREFAPQIPEQVWVSFGRVDPRATSINLFMRWHYGFGRGDVLIRNIPLRQ